MIQRTTVQNDRLEGVVSSLLRKRASRDFVLQQMGEKRGTATAAIGLAAGGMGGAAVGVAAIDSREEADYVEFNLDQRKVRGWFWRFPFADGDELELVGEQSGDDWVCYGARRVSDGLVAVYPHCFEGSKAHWRSSLKFWGGFTFATYLFLMLLVIVVVGVGDFPSKWLVAAQIGFLYAPGVLVLLYGFLGYRATRRTLGFCRLAEDIFRGFGWPDPANINLRKTSRARRGPKESREYGDFFFRY